MFLLPDMKPSTIPIPFSLSLIRIQYLHLLMNTNLRKRKISLRLRLSLRNGYDFFANINFCRWSCATSPRGQHTGKYKYARNVHLQD